MTDKSHIDKKTKNITDKHKEARLAKDLKILAKIAHKDPTFNSEDGCMYIMGSND